MDAISIDTLMAVEETYRDKPKKARNGKMVDRLKKCANALKIRKNQEKPR